MLRLQLCLEATVNDYFMPLETWPFHSDTRQVMIVGIAKSACGHASGLKCLSSTCCMAVLYYYYYYYYYYY